MIYLDNAATTKIDDEVLEAMMPYLTDNYGNAGAVYSIGRKSAEAIAKARQQVADLIGAEPEQIIFTSGGTEANNLVFAGSAKYLKSVGKTHIITSKTEHDSVLNAVNNLCESQGDFDAEFITPELNSGEISTYKVVDAINSTEKTGLVSIMHTNNETGVDNPVGEIGTICKERGILFHTDCVQAIGAYRIDVKEIGCDFLTISSHKIHGAKGVGALYVRDKSILSPAILGGSHQEFGLRGGTENVAGIVGFGKACELLNNNLEKESQGISRLRYSLLIWIKRYLTSRMLGEFIHINGRSNNSKILNMRFDGVDGETLLLMLDANGVCVSAGSACTSHESEPSHVLLAMGIDAESARNSIRISLSKDNTLEEIEQAARIIADCVASLHKS